MAASWGTVTMRDEHRAYRLLAAGRVPSPPTVPEVRRPIWWWSLSEYFVLLGSVSGDGIRSVDLPQESSQLRSLPRFHRRQALPHGIPRKDSTFDVGRCERSSRLANLADFAQVLIAIARPLYALDPIGVDLDQSLYTLDSTIIDLCLALFPWAKFRKHKAAVKMHTLLDLRGPHVYPCPCGEPA